MNPLKPALWYVCAVKRRAVGIFYLIQYAAFGLVCLLVALFTGRVAATYNGMEAASAAFVGVVGVLTFQEDFRALLQQGCTRRCIFAASVCQFGLLACFMAAVDTALTQLLHRLMPTFVTVFGLLYGQRGALVNGLWLAAAYWFVCSLCYLAVVVRGRVGKTTFLALGVGALALLVVFVTFLRLVVPRAAARAALTVLGLPPGGGVHPLTPVLLFLALGALLSACSYALLRRTECF